MPLGTACGAEGVAYVVIACRTATASGRATPPWAASSYTSKANASVSSIRRLANTPSPTANCRTSTQPRPARSNALKRSLTICGAGGRRMGRHGLRTDHADVDVLWRWERGGYGRDALEGGSPPPPPLAAPGLRPATVPLTPGASLNGICNRE